MKRRFQPVLLKDLQKGQTSFEGSGVFWPVDRWDDELAQAQPLLKIADEYRILRMPLMGQDVKHDDGKKSPGTLCGPTSASMVYNFWQLCQHPDDPESHYFKMTRSDAPQIIKNVPYYWNLRDTSGIVIPFANLDTVKRSAKGIGYLPANFADHPSIHPAKSELWVQEKCKLIVSSIVNKCPVVLYTRFSVTPAHQHIITVSGYAKFAGELWLLILDPESLEDHKGSNLKNPPKTRLNTGMFTLAPWGPKVSRADLKTFNSATNTIRLLEGKFTEALGSLYFLKASHLFAPHCTDFGFSNYQNADSKKFGYSGNYFHHGHKAPSIAVPDELVLSSGIPQVTAPVLLWTMEDLAASVKSMVQSHPATQAETKNPPTSKPSASGKSLSQKLESALKVGYKIRDLVEGGHSGY